MAGNTTYANFDKNSSTVPDNDTELRFTESPLIDDIGTHHTKEYFDSQTGEITKYRSNLRLVKGGVVERTSQQIGSEQISIDDLYPARQAVSPQLATALQLLNEGIDNVREALSAENDIGADAAIQRLQALLPELFCCRQLSDSFGTVIVATFHALKNLDGQPLNRKQMVAVGKVLRRIRSEPFMNFDDAAEEIMELEDVGFEVEPKEFKYLADWLDE